MPRDIERAPIGLIAGTGHMGQQRAGRAVVHGGRHGGDCISAFVWRRCVGRSDVFHISIVTSWGE